MSLTSSPYINNKDSISHVMLSVIYALIPGTLVFIHYFGWGVLINMAIAVTTAIVCEAAILKLRYRPVKVSLFDGSAVLTALLLALAIPTLTPWWLAALGTAFAIIIAKHLYGGLGYNPFNPAMVGYAMLLISFPREMTAWIPAETHGLGFMDSLNYAFQHLLPAGMSYDAITMATPLDNIKNQLNLGLSYNEIINSGTTRLGYLSGFGWEWINLTFLAGGLVLLYMRIISWHIPVAIILSLGVMSGLFNFADANTYTPATFHLFAGATMLGAFFIATDPVTAPASNIGRLYYGAGIGILIYVIRTWGGYPDAIAFSVLIMNMAVPMIDYYTRPKSFGEAG